MRCVVANWKMNHTQGEVAHFCDRLQGSDMESREVKVGIAPSFPYLYQIGQALQGKGILVFAQNAHHEPKGAYTGEVSMVQLRDLGVSGVILGHSERRQYFGETEETLAPKLRAARSHELLPLLCVGETLAEREAGHTLSVLRRQLSILSVLDPGPLWIAYEPVWAIGTGVRAEAHQVMDAHAFIHEEVTSIFANEEDVSGVPILYGGSVNPENFSDLLEIPKVAGGLIGGASLKPDSFLEMIHQAQK